MTSDQTATTQPLEAMQHVLSRLQATLQELGLGLSVWDSFGQCVGALQAGCEFCRTVSAAGEKCTEDSGRLARVVLDEKRSAKDRSSVGCCLVGVPLYQRRRLIGAVVAGYPVRQMLEEENLARLCDRLHLDRQVVSRQAMEACRHGEEEADDFLRVLARLLEHEQAARTANEELATLSANLASTWEELSLLYRISSSMKVTQGPREFLQNVCNELMEVMNISAAAVVAYGHTSGRGADVVVSGKIDLDEGGIQVLADQRIAPRFTREKRPVLENKFLQSAGGEFDGAVRNFVAAPLVADDNLIGILIALNKRSGDFDSTDMKLVNSIANQAAVFLANSRLYEDIQDLLMGVLHALTASIDAKDPYTCGHSQRVALISRRLAEESGFTPEKAQRVYLAGLLHDVGKIGVAESTLRKEGRLTDEEYRNVKKHSVLGAKILGGIRQLQDVVVGILHHHERPDGKGYPYGLKGNEISLEGLIVGLADCFDAMTSNRTYREALPLEAVIAEIRRNAGTQFDERLVQKLLSLDLRKFAEEIHLSAQSPLHGQPGDDS